MKNILTLLVVLIFTGCDWFEPDAVKCNVTAGTYAVVQNENFEHIGNITPDTVNNTFCFEESINYVFIDENYSLTVSPTSYFELVLNYNGTDVYKLIPSSTIDCNVLN